MILQIEKWCVWLKRAEGLFKESEEKIEIVWLKVKGGREREMRVFWFCVVILQQIEE